MPNFVKINGVALSSVVKFAGVAKTSIAKMFSFTNPDAGGGGGGGPSFTAVNGATIGDEIQTNGGYITGNWADFVTFNGNSTVESSFNISFWWKLDETPVSGVTPEFALFGGQNANGTQGYLLYISDHYSSGLKLKSQFGVHYFTDRENMISSNVNDAHPWNHFVLVRKGSGGQQYTRIFWNGVQVASTGTSTNFIPQDSSLAFAFGARDSGGTNSSYSTFFDNIEITEGDHLTNSEVLALYNAGR